MRLGHWETSVQHPLRSASLTFVGSVSNVAFEPLRSVPRGRSVKLTEFIKEPGLHMQDSEAIFFCHGMPGSEHDARLLRNIEDDTRMLAPNMLHKGAGDPISDVLKTFDELTIDFADRQVNLVGFSIGAMIAIKIATVRPERVGRLTLISPAAPLSLGDFLPEMAGAPVFNLAIKRPKALRALTFGQGLLSRVSPGFLIKLLFTKCGESEKKLLEDPEFHDVIMHGLSNSFVRGPKIYVQFVQSYVEDWSADLAKVTCAVEIWHGAKDTWSPIAMSYKLCDTIAAPHRLHVVQDGEHYSTLTKASVARLGPAS